MADTRAKLETIFALEDASQRVQAFLEYARRVKVNVLKARNEDGSYSEDLLAVLIFDAEEKRQKSRFTNIGILLLAGIIFMAIAAAIALLYFIISTSVKSRTQEGRRLMPMIQSAQLILA